jgi:hypothetical protein
VGIIVEAKPFLAFVFVSLATYALIVIGVFIAGGMDTSCASDCAAWENWMADNDPWPVAIGVSVSIVAGVGAALRVR